MRNFLRLKSFFIKHKWYYVFGILTILCVDILQLWIPRILGKFTDGVKDATLTNSQMLTYAGLIIVVATGMVIFRFAWRMFIFGAARNLEYSLRNDLFGQFQKLSTTFFNNHKTGDLMAHATNDINAVRMAAGPGIIMIADTIILLSATIFMMITTISLKLTLVALLPLPFMAIISGIFGRSIHSRFRRAQEAFSNLTDKVQENI
ncbi:MAG: ABC transporter transmembrane domain-containing protein, partial [Bacilli bacterium]